MTAHRTLKRDTLRRLERAAMRWYRLYRQKKWSPMMPLYNACEIHEHAQQASRNRSLAQQKRFKREALAANTQSQAGGKRRKRV